MDYQTAIAYLYSFTDFERDPGQGQLSGIFGLERIGRLLAELGHPERCAPVIHLAGTKGKGSTAAFIESILRQAGLRTGLFTSPHLHDFAERIQIAGRPIEAPALTGAIEALYPVIEPRRQPPATGGLTTFEITTALAFVCFRSAGVDVQVIETGLGGRLDATNLVDPAVVVITPIGYDHTAILGDTLEAIATEKAGIIKTNAPVVLGPQPAGALDVFRERCAALGAPASLYGRDFRAEGPEPSLAGQAVTVWSGERRYDASLPLLGRHQAENAALAVRAVELLRSRTDGDSQFASIDEAAIVRGLERLDWPGRFDIVRRSPWVVADGAHTGESAARLQETFAAVFPGRRARIVLGTSRDKPVDAIVSALAPIAADFIVTAADHPRALAVADLAARLSALGLNWHRADSTRAALDGWIAEAGPVDVLIATGSLFVAAEAIRWSVLTQQGSGPVGAGRFR